MMGLTRNVEGFFAMISQNCFFDGFFKIVSFLLSRKPFSEMSEFS
jgi:hypothetical protein